MKLTIVVPNRNRFDFTQFSSQYFLRSLQWQNCLDFELLVVDGRSDNYEEIKSYLESNTKFKTTVIQHEIGEIFHKTLLNNVGIRKCKEYVATTDCDILFHPKFIDTVKKYLSPDIFIESRTMYWKECVANKIYNGEIDPYSNIDGCKMGKILKRSTCGGFQCMHINNWYKLRGYNEEEIVGWGSDDIELLERVMRAGIRVHWLGENGDIMLFHQPHPKNITEELKTQEKNKRALSNIKIIANPHGWGGIT